MPVHPRYSIIADPRNDAPQAYPGEAATFLRFLASLKVIQRQLHSPEVTPASVRCQK